MPVADFAHGVKDSSYWSSHLNSISAKTKTADAKTPTAAATTASADPSGPSFWDDVLDVVNPLQHLPVVSTVYRAITGDKIGDLEKVAGDTLYGGPMGLVSSLADLAFEKITGKDFGDTVMSALGLEHDDAPTALAANAPKTSTTNGVAANTAAAKPATLTAAKPRIVASTSPTALSKLAASELSPVVAKPAVSKPASAPVQPAVQSAPQAAASTTQQQAAAASQKPVDISPDTDALLNALARNGVTGDMQAQALDAYRRTMSMNTTPTTALVN